MNNNQILNQLVNDKEKAAFKSLEINGEEDVFQLRFKHFSNKYKDGQEIELEGNLRSYSEKLIDGKNKVSIYIFTYFDIPETDAEDHEVINNFAIDGRICKLDQLRISATGKQSVHFILANNIITEGSHQKLNAYIPMVAFGQTAVEIANMHVSDKLLLHGNMNSRTYKKLLDNNELEFKVAYEGIVSDYELI